jgi:Ca-activated chloride channel family protein
MGCAAHAQTNSPTTHIRVAIQPHGQTQSPVVTQSGWINAAPVQSRLVVGSDGQTYVGIWIDTPQGGQVQAQRAPVDLALVIDNSGSMSGEKIANARMAASSLLESLAEGDIVSVYTFSNDVTEIAPPTVVNNMSRGQLIQRVSMIQPMGGTNLYDGLRVGEARLAEAPGTHAVRRIVLISDGMANIGPSSPEELGNLAANGTESGAQVSAIGVGLEYDERTLGALAMRSSGRLYHLEQPSQMAAILRQELNLLDQTVATDAYIEVEPAPGVQLLGVEAASSQNVNGHLRVPLGALYGGQHREMLVRVRIPTTSAGERQVANAQLVFRDTARAHATHTQAVPLNVALVSDTRAANASRDARVSTMVASYEAAQAQIRAAQQLSQGQNVEAERTLAAAETQLQQVAAAAPAAQRDRIMRQTESVRRGRATAVNAAPASSAGRAGALRINADAYDAMGL